MNDQQYYHYLLLMMMPKNVNCANHDIYQDTIGPNLICHFKYISTNDSHS